MGNPKVLIVGSAEKSGGGVSSVIKLMKKMTIWEKYSCYWLGTQIQRNYLWKLWFAIKAALITPFIIWRFDIVHFHTVPDKVCLVVQMPELICAKLFGKKVIMHVHMGNQLLQHTHNKLFKWCLNRSDRIVLLADKWKKLFEQEFADVKVPLNVVYNACDTSGKHPLVEKEKLIIMAGYFDDNKAPDILIKAWSKLKEMYPEWRLVLMGNGDVERFRRIAYDFEVDKCISFPGYLVGKEKEIIWNRASIFCLCSYNEGFPMVVLEAWNYGIPVISTPVGGLPDVIVEGKNCLTFPFGDIDMLASQLKTLIDNTKLREEMGVFSKQFVKDTFSLDSVNDMWDSLYSDMLVK